MSDLSVTIDTSRLEWKINELAKALHEDPREVFIDEMRLLNKTIVNFIPPTREKGKTAGSAQAVGEHAVESQIKNLVSEAKPELIDTIGSEYGISNIKDAYITRNDGTKVQLKWDHLDPTGARLPEYHRLYRSRDGRIPYRKEQSQAWAARVVVPVGARKPFIEARKRMVGFWKATWAACMAGPPFNVHFPRYVSRHFGRVGGLSVCQPDFSNPEKFGVTFGSRRAGNYRMQERINDAVRFRCKVISRRIKLILSDYNRDIWQGMRRRTKAIKSGEQIGVE